MQSSGTPVACRAGRLPQLTRVRGTHPRALIRVLTYVGVLAGVLAMHGLTMNHDAAMVRSPAAAMAMAEQDVKDTAGTGHHRAGAEQFAATVSAASHTAHLGAPRMPMGAMCIAVLASVLLVSLALKLIWLRSARPARRPASIAVVPSSTLGRAPPRLAPSLSKLCVLRI